MMMLNVYLMRKPALASVLLALSASVSALSPSCMLGAKCISTQGTSIPSAKVLVMMEHCDEFMKGGVGRRVLRMSMQEIVQQSGNDHMHPLFSAYYAFNELHDSPLKFDRKASGKNIDYAQVVHACQQLNIDFESWSRRN